MSIADDKDATKSEGVYKMLKKEKELLDTFMYAMNTGLLLNKGNIDINGKATIAARITLEGHADERGSRDYNLGLGERRGNGVSSALQANGGSATQLTTVSYGEERPVCTDVNEDCWARNRRVEIVYSAR